MVANTHASGTTTTEDNVRLFDCSSDSDRHAAYVAFIDFVPPGLSARLKGSL